MKTSDLIGPALDWAVAKAEGINFSENGWKALNVFLGARVGGQHRYSTDWSQGGPIIEREKIQILPQAGRHSTGLWFAGLANVGTPRNGPTPLIAAMRCFTASKLGDEVDIPKELMCQKNR